MIEINNVWKRYHTYKASDWVLRDINLTIPRNVSVGLIGRNGAGKTTLLRLIAAMDSPDRGSISRRCQVSWPVGLVSGLEPTMTGRQNIKFVARIHGNEDAIPDVMQFVEEFAEIGNAIDRPVKTYSTGMRARLNFGLALAFDFDVYLSDEATAVGDKAFKRKARKAFKKRVRKASLIIVSHSESILKELCEAGIYLEGGSAHWFDDVNDALRAYHSAPGVLADLPRRKNNR